MKGNTSGASNQAVDKCIREYFGKLDSEFVDPNEHSSSSSDDEEDTKPTDKKEQGVKPNVLTRITFVMLPYLFSAQPTNRANESGIDCEKLYATWVATYGKPTVENVIGQLLIIHEYNYQAYYNNVLPRLPVALRTPLLKLELSAAPTEVMGHSTKKAR
jgi:hypothetical protein